jgi:outer membrane protein assembly factor BamB
MAGEDGGLEAGDFVFLRLDTPEGGLRMDHPFGDELRILLGTGTYPELEAGLVGQSVGDMCTFELIDDQDDDITIGYPPTQLDTVLPTRVANVIQQADIDSAWEFLRTDPQELATKFALDRDRMARAQDSVETELADRYVFEYEIVDAYRYRNQDEDANNTDAPVDSWPTFQACRARTGQAPITIGPGSPVECRWTHTTNAEIISSPVVRNNTVYVGSNDGTIYALDAATGDIRWTLTIGGEVVASPTVVNNTVFIGGTDGIICAVDAATGDVHWTYTGTDSVASSPGLIDDTVYIGIGEKVYALHASNGQIRWVHSTEGEIFSSPAIVGDTVYIGSYDGTVYALDTATGDTQWTYSTEDIVVSSPAVVSNTVYVSSYDSTVSAINATTGTRQWTYTTNGMVASSPAVVDGTVYIASADEVNSSPAVAGGTVYVGNQGGTLYALSGRQ